MKFSPAALSAITLLVETGRIAAAAHGQRIDDVATKESKGLLFHKHQEEDKQVPMSWPSSQEDGRKKKTTSMDDGTHNNNNNRYGGVIDDAAHGGIGGGTNRKQGMCTTM